MGDNVCLGKIVAEEQILEAERRDENQYAGGNARLPRAFHQQRVPSHDGGDAAYQRVHCADKCEQERKRTEYIHSASASPQGPSTGSLHAASLSSAGRGWLIATGSGLVLGSALSLHVFGDKSAIGAGTPFNQSLRLVLERVRQRIAANVRDGKCFPL